MVMTFALEPLGARATATLARVTSHEAAPGLAIETSTWRELDCRTRLRSPVEIVEN